MSEPTAATTVTFWGAGTGRSLRPIWVAEELNLPYRVEPIGPRTGETKTPEYTKLNPKQKIPFMVDGDLHLSESVAICRYLVSKYGRDETLVTAASIEERALQDEWMSFIYGELDETGLYVIRRHGDLAPIYGEAPVAIAAAKHYVARQLSVVEQRLQDRDYLLEDRFTLPDIFLTTCLNWAIHCEIAITDVLEEYRQRIVERPAYVRAVANNQPPQPRGKVSWDLWKE